MIEAMFHIAGLQKIFEKALDAARRHAIWTLTFSTFCLVLAAVQASRLNVELDLYSKDAKGFETTRDFREQKHRFRDTNQALLIFVPQSGAFNLREVCQIREWLTRELKSNSEIADITTPFEIRQAHRTDDKVWYPLYLDLDCDSANATALAKPVDFKPLRETPWADSLTDKNGHDFAVEVLFRDTPGGSRFGAFDPEPIKRLHAKAQQELGPKVSGLTIYLAGASAFESHLKDAMLKDIWLQGLVFLLIVVAFRFLFGTMRAGFVFILTLLATLTLVYGLMSFCGVALDLLTSNLVLMTTLAGLEDFLFVSMLMRAGNTRSEALRRMIVPCFLTTLTTVIGFLSLQMSDVAIIGRFGVWAAWGAIAEWLVMFFVLPAVFEFSPKLSHWVDRKRMANLGWIQKVANIKANRFSFRISFVLFAAGIGAFWFLNLNEIPTQNFPKDHITSRTHDYLAKTRGWEAAVYLIFERPNLREHRSDVKEVLNKLRQQKDVTSIVDPFSIEEFVARPLPNADHPIVETEIQLASSYRRVFSGRDEARAVVYLAKSDLDTLETFTLKVRELCPNATCRVSGHSAVYLEYSRKIVPTLLESFGVSLALVSMTLFLLALALGMRQKFAIVYTAIWGPVAMLAVIALFQIPVSLMTSLFAATIVGLTGDNGIQFMFASQKGNLQQGLEERSQSSVILSLLLAVASLVFLAETVKPMQILGILFFTGFIMNLAGDLWLLKGALQKD
jgi:uncharacterized protein